MTDPMPAGLLQGRATCRAELRRLLCGLSPPAGAEAVFDTPPPDVLLVDSHFADWPLDDPAVLTSLAHWLRPPGRRLRLIGVDFAAVAQNHARFARWRRDWTHRIEVLTPVDGALAPGLRLLLAGPVAAQWLDAPDWRLRLVTQALQVAVLREKCADFLQRCEPAWPVTTLGL